MKRFLAGALLRGERDMVRQRARPQCIGRLKHGSVLVHGCGQQASMQLRPLPAQDTRATAGHGLPPLPHRRECVSQASSSHSSERQHTQRIAWPCGRPGLSRPTTLAREHVYGKRAALRVYRLSAAGHAGCRGRLLGSTSYGAENQSAAPPYAVRVRTVLVGRAAVSQKVVRALLCQLRLH